MIESRIFGIQEERRKEHSIFECAFSEFDGENFEKYRGEVGKITEKMQKLATETAKIRDDLSNLGKHELAAIVDHIQRQEEELLIVRFVVLMFAISIKIWYY